MKEQMETQFRAQQNPTENSSTDTNPRNWNKPSSKPGKEDYLEFEEIKEE